MNEWLIASAVLVAALLPLQWVALRGRAAAAMVALNQAGLLAVAALMLLVEGFGRSPFMELPEILAVVAFVGILAFARVFERWA